MNFDNLLEQLGENTKEVSNEAVKSLIKIIDNIISDPENVSVRTLHKSNEMISKQILSVSGGSLCLKLIGFEETSTAFSLPSPVKISKLNEIRDLLLIWKESVEFSERNEENEKSGSATGGKEQEKIRPSIDLTKNESWDKQNDKRKIPIQKPIALKAVIKPILLPPMIAYFKNPFLHKLEIMFHTCLQYGNEDLLKRAQSVIPIKTLEIAAQNRLRSIQKHIKLNQLKEPNISAQDMIILELLQWFKEKFFTWVDSPNCKFCGDQTKYSHMAKDEKLFIYTKRVEMHKCTQCGQLTPFPRYHDLNILLESRRGRCGESANLFTLLCRSMGWDARYVVDETDHVWTEVFSLAQNRWLHCDPCENVCDKPLIYENGWNKKISYIIAYSDVEVQDVTWRYTSNHKDVITRRNSCTEADLIRALLLLRKKRQHNFSETKKEYLTKRILLELVELMFERKPNDDEKVGRMSGDEAWRLARGEFQQQPEQLLKTGYVWKVSTNQIDSNKVTVRYSTSKDVYQFIVDNEIKQEKEQWSSGCFVTKNIFRKEEKDWKQVYLVRTENCGDAGTGFIAWKFSIECDCKILDVVEIKFQSTVFESGVVTAEISSENISESIPSDHTCLTTQKFSGCKTFTVTANLSGGKGDTAWQHAQIFRQPIDSSDFPFVVNLIFKERN